MYTGSGKHNNADARYKIHLVKYIQSKKYNALLPKCNIKLTHTKL